eukprot:TRINITY_DN1290_c0_g2_i20.p3 TRINITY_DN1290_c0_g2~~TRINITY_DN1290_c0_g2_i20.p3  ORF type:complete len:200 (-),score=57.22 TRINITY_DN1290_c0_g2_i20:208-807(-)
MSKSRDNVKEVFRERLAFFLNLHNLIILYGMCKAPAKSFPKKWKDWADYARSLKFKVDKFLFSPFEIQHIIIRGCMVHNKELFAKNGVKLSVYNGMEEKQRFVLPKMNLVAIFGFYFPYKSSPPLTPFTPQNVKQQLKLLARSCLAKATAFKKNKLKLPGLLELCKCDLDAKENGLMKFMRKHLDVKGKEKYEQWLKVR